MAEISSEPALYQVSVRNLAAVTRMWLTTILCQLTDTFAGFLPTVRYLPAVALVSYLIDRSHSWYTAFLKTFVLIQGTYTPQVNRHAWRTKALHRSWLAFRFFKLVSFVYAFWFFNVHSRWSASPVNLVVLCDRLHRWILFTSKHQS